MSFKEEILAMDDCELLNTFEELIAAETKATNFSSRGPSKELLKRIDWVREEILVRMR